MSSTFSIIVICLIAFADGVIVGWALKEMKGRRDA